MKAHNSTKVCFEGKHTFPADIGQKKWHISLSFQEHLKYKEKKNTVATFIDSQNFSAEGKRNNFMVQVPHIKDVCSLKSKHPRSALKVLPRTGPQSIRIIF